jgi:hypothetical protein
MFFTNVPNNRAKDYRSAAPQPVRIAGGGHMKLLSLTLLSVAFLVGVASAQAPQANSGNKVPELKTQTYKGTLMDASCSATGTSTPAAANATSTKSATSADRSSAGSCSVSSNTSEFALQTKDGHTLKFDSVGNERAKEALKAKKKWSEAVSSGKPIQATVSAAETGDKLTVMAIH